MTHSMNLEFPGVTPQLTVRDTDAAVRFYRTAFGADELYRNTGPDGRVFHCELLINGGRLLLHDDFTDDGETPAALGGSPVVLHMYTDDVDAAFAAAIAAGATADMEPQDAFWGDRYAMLTDPFGHHWSLGTVKEQLSVAEQEARADQWSGQGDQR